MINIYRREEHYATSDMYGRANKYWESNGAWCNKPTGLYELVKSPEFTAKHLVRDGGFVTSAFGGYQMRREVDILLATKLAKSLGCGLERVPYFFALNQYESEIIGISIREMGDIALICKDVPYFAGPLTHGGVLITDIEDLSKSDGGEHIKLLFRLPLGYCLNNKHIALTDGVWINGGNIDVNVNSIWGANGICYLPRAFNCLLQKKEDGDGLGGNWNEYNVRLANTRRVQ